MVICAYNAASCISGILTSLQHQTFKNFEIVVANDGSTDATPEIARSFGTTGMKVTVVDMLHQGLSAARNVGITNSRAPYVAIIDADCVATPSWLEEAYRVLEEGDIVVTGNTKIPQSTFLGDCISGLGYPGGGHLGFERMWPVDDMGYTKHLAGGNCAFRKQDIVEIGAFNEKLTITGDDVYLSQRILQQGHKIKYDPDMVMFHQPRKDLGSFIRWHYARGKGSYFFKQQVGGFAAFYRLRLWSTKNMILKYWRSPKIIVMLPLLGLSFVVQKVGYVVQMVKST